MTPTLFVGSSTEALPIAEAVQRAMRHVANVTIWTQGVFSLNQTVFEDLILKARYYDYAIFIFSKDDILSIRGNTENAVRDNVVFELGLFSAILGPKRCFFLVPRAPSSFRIPTDLRGLIYATYDLDGHQGNIDGAIGTACSDVVAAIRSPGPLSGDWYLYIEGSDHSSPNGMFQIVQAGTRVTARLDLTKSKNGNETSRKFVYDGRYVGGQIVLQFEQTGVEDYVIGSMTLRSRTDMTRMRGVTAFWHHDEGKIIVEYFELTKHRK